MPCTWQLQSQTTGEKEEDDSDIKMAMDEFPDEQRNKQANADEMLTPFEKMKKFADSENIFERQMVVRIVLDTMRSVRDCPHDLDIVLAILCKLSEDIEPSVRAELMEQIPHIAMLCHEYRGRLMHVAFQFLLPVVVNYLQDINNQVRKTSQAALLMMLEQDLVNKGLIEEQVCPVVLRLTEKDNHDDLRSEAVALMSKMAPLVGKEITERLFLNNFANLCMDDLLHVRKVCAANFGDFCTVIGTEATEKFLLPRFSYLCEDGVWNVRKACADVFTTVSYMCSLEIRHSQLTLLFVNLLRDDTRWVRMAAFQALGPFISTFADPSRTGLYFSDDGQHIVRDSRFYEDDAFSLFVTEELMGADENANNDEEKEEFESRIVLENADRKYQWRGNLDDPSIATKSSMTASEDEFLGHLIIVDNDNTAHKFGQTPDCIQGSDRDEQCLNAVSDSKTGTASTASNNDDIAEALSDNFLPCDSNVNICDDDKSTDHNANRAVPTPGQKSETTVESDNGSNASSIDGHSQLNVSGSQPGHCEKRLSFHIDERAFNSFHYWRIPIPDIELDIDVVEGRPAKVSVKARVDHYRRSFSSELSVSFSDADGYGGHFSTDMQNLNLDSSPSVVHTRIRTASVGMVHEDGSEKNGSGAYQVLTTSVNEAVATSFNGIVTDLQQSYDSQHTAPRFLASEWEDSPRPLENVSKDRNNKAGLFNLCSPGSIVPVNNPLFSSREYKRVKAHILQQTIVPQELLEHYVSMSDPAQMQTVDNELARHCAYSLPAVAMTLGRKNWPILKQLYETLASDMQWKVRRTLAFSIHELASILGEGLANSDLMPVFNGFVKDLDEVRVGVLRHVAAFLKLLNPKERRECLPKLPEFLKTDNECNWRFRLELTEQLGMIASLYQPDDISQHLMPVAIHLIGDKVAEVRQVAMRLVCLLVREVNTSITNEPSLVKGFLAILAEQFAHHSKWSRRQTFAYLCSHLIEAKALPLQQFAHDLLPHLLDLSYDPVPNVRLSVAKTLSQTIVPLDYYSSHHNPYHDLLLEVLRRLQVDQDRDVRYYANLAPQSYFQSTSDSSTQLVPPV